MFSPIRRSILYFASARFVIAIPLRVGSGSTRNAPSSAPKERRQAFSQARGQGRGCVTRQTRSRGRRARLKRGCLKDPAAAVKPPVRVHAYRDGRLETATALAGERSAHS